MAAGDIIENLRRQRQLEQQAAAREAQLQRQPEPIQVGEEVFQPEPGGVRAGALDPEALRQIVREQQEGFVPGDVPQAPGALGGRLREALRRRREGTAGAFGGELRRRLQRLGEEELPPPTRDLAAEQIGPGTRFAEEGRRQRAANRVDDARIFIEDELDPRVADVLRQGIEDFDAARTRVAEGRRSPRKGMKIVEALDSLSDGTAHIQPSNRLRRGKRADRYEVRVVENRTGAQVTRVTTFPDKASADAFADALRRAADEWGQRGQRSGLRAVLKWRPKLGPTRLRWLACVRPWPGWLDLICLRPRGGYPPEPESRRPRV